MRLPGSGLLAIAVVLVAAAWMRLPGLDQPFYTQDDWYHLSVAAGLLAGDGAAWGEAFRGESGHTALRPVPFVLYCLDLLLHGVDARGWYATTHSLHLALAGVAGLVARRLGGVAAGVVATAAVAWNGAVDQAGHYIPARADQCAALAVALGVLLWPLVARRPGGRMLALAFAAGALLCKLPALVLAPLLWVHDRLTGAPRRPTWVWAGFAMVGAIWALTLLALWSGQGSLSPGWTLHPIAARRLVALVAPEAALGRSVGWAAPALLGVAWLASLGSLRLRGPPGRARRLARLGIAWASLGWAVQLPWLMQAANGPDLGGRYLLVPATGASLLLAAAVAALPRRLGAPVAALAALILAQAWTGEGRAEFFRQDATGQRLLEAAVEAPPGSSLEVRLQRPGLSAETLVGSGLLERLRPDLEWVDLTLLGQPRRLRATPWRFGRSGFEASDGVTADLVLVERRDGGGAHFEAPTAPATPAAGELVVADFTSSEAGWGPDRHHGASWSGGWHLQVRQPLHARSLSVDLSGPAARRPAHLVSGPLRLGSVCSIRVEVRAAREVSRSDEGTALVPEPDFALLLWGGSAPSFDQLLVLPLRPHGDGVEVGEARIQGLPGWPQMGTLGLVPHSQPGPVLVERVVLGPCE